MNKNIIAVFLLAILVMGLAAAGQVKTNTAKGFVYCKSPNGLGWHVSDADVDVTCTHSSTATTLSGTTNPGGQYSIDFLSTACDTGDSMTIYAEKGSNNGTNTGTMGNNNANIDVYIGDCPVEDNEVPEFSSLAATTALIGSTLGFIALRRKR